MFPGISEEESDVQDFDLIEASGNITTLNTGVATNGCDFFFGEGDIEAVNFDYDPLQLSNVHSGQVG